MKKLVLAVLGLAFAFGITACQDHREQRQCDESGCPDSGKEERHERKW